MNIRILSESDVRAVIDMAAAIDIQAEAFTLLAEGRSMQGLRSFAVSENPPGIAIFNPAFLTEGAGYGVKVVSDFYGNPKRGAPRMTALVALFDGENGTTPHRHGRRAPHRSQNRRGDCTGRPISRPTELPTPRIDWRGQSCP